MLFKDEAENMEGSRCLREQMAVVLLKRSRRMRGREGAKEDFRSISLLEICSNGIPPINRRVAGELGLRVAPFIT